MPTTVFGCDGISKSYQSRRVLGPVTIQVSAGERLAVMGPSGSGKTTLLHCLAGLESVDAGKVSFLGHDWDAMPDRNLRDLRLRHMGLLFQSPDLLSELTLTENVALPLEFSGVRRRLARTRARELLGRLGLTHVWNSYPHRVSGGEAQRAALARALVAEPAAILADEPTGALDSANRDLVLEVLVGLAGESGASLVVVTHDPVVAAALDRKITLIDGQLQDAC